MSFVVISTSALIAQQTFRSTAVIVEVDTIVTDGKGRFVTDLTADDFEVLEEGQPQKIERMYLVSGNSVTVQPTATGTEDSAGRTAPAPPPPAPQRVFVLLFDQEHLQEGSFKRIRDAAIAFLTNEFHQGDVGGIVIGSTMVGNQLTSDREALLTAVRNAKPSAAKTSRRLQFYEWPRLSGEAEAVRIALFNDREVLAQAVRRACQDDPSVCRNLNPEAELMEKARSIVGELRPAARRTVMTLQQLANGLTRLPGRKTIVLMTEGFFVEESWADLRQIVGATARSNVRIYSLDARGLDTRQANDLHQLGVMDPGGSMPLEAYNTSEDGPNMLARDTGGYPIRHTNTFADALTEIARDTSNYYVIGYSPASPSMDGTFRKIAVRVKRPGLTVRARRGYLAATAGASAPAPPKVEERVPSPEPATPLPAAVGESAVAPPVPATPDLPVVPAAEENAAHAFSLRPDSNAHIRDLASREATLASANSAASRGWDRYQQGDLEGAAEWLGKAVTEPNARPWVHYALGYSELALSHPENAARAWETVRAAVPEFQPVYINLADAYVHVANYGRAIDVLRAAEARWPEDLDVLNAMGTIQVRRAALNDAIDTFKRAAEAKPDEALAYFNLARTYELRYFKTRRYSQSEARWLANPADLKAAIASYEQYLERGGPFEGQAREAIQKLQWIK